MGEMYSMNLVDFTSLLNTIESNPTNNQNWESYINALMMLYQKGQIADMETGAALLVERWPDIGLGWKVLGASLKIQGRNAEAIAPLAKAVSLLPDDPDAAYNLGLAYHEAKDLKQAENSYAAAVKINQRLDVAYNGLGRVCFEQQRFSEAVNHYRASLSITPNSPAVINNLANALRYTGQLDEAITTCKRAIELAPDFVLAHNLLGNLLFLVGEFEVSVQAYDRAAAICRHNPEDTNNSLLAAVGRSASLGSVVPFWHIPMMNDKPRNDAYYAALSSAISSETHVLDIGSGAGLLAMMSAQLGAARVDACEMVPRIAVVTKEIVRDNGFDKVIHVHGKVSTKLEVGTDLPKRANLVVSEIFSSELVGEGVLPAIEDAKERLIERNAKIIPAAASIRFALFTGDEIKQNLFVDSVYGFDVRRFNSTMASKIMLHRDDLNLEFLSDSMDAFRFDFAQQSTFLAESKKFR